jgi:hypothetical protein
VPDLRESIATLRISGDDLVPEAISALLGFDPTGSHLNGQTDVLSSGAVRVRKTGLWSISTKHSRPANFDGQVAELLGQLTDDLTVWRGLSDRYDIDLFCGWFMGDSNAGIEIGVATLKKLAQRGIRIDLDIYAPSSE